MLLPTPVLPRVVELFELDVVMSFLCLTLGVARVVFRSVRWHLEHTMTDLDNLTETAPRAHLAKSVKVVVVVGRLREGKRFHVERRARVKS